jgi:hypothetical protein
LSSGRDGGAQPIKILGDHDNFKSTTNRDNLTVDRGALSAGGHVEYARNAHTVSLTHAGGRAEK